MEINKEREMSLQQRQLVDHYFDEGQYDMGISTLNGLRDPRWLPSPQHIRQLVYLALYPPPDPSELASNEKENEIPEATKLGFKVHKEVHVPNPAATIAAQDILMEFAATNTPAGLLRGLPKYVERNSEEDVIVGEDDEDSFISKKAKCFRHSKNCWEILRDGFVKHHKEEVAQKRGRGRPRRRPGGDDEDEDGSVGYQSAVGENAWPVLQWLLAIFERDERLTIASENLQYSSVLLSQVPPPRMGSGGRWDVEGPLNVICASVSQDQERRKLCGPRLLTLLINLTNSTHMDMKMFINVTNNRLFTLPFEELEYLLDNLHESAPVKRFKLNFYCTYLSQECSIGRSVDRPRPVRRAKPVSARSKSGTSTGVSTPTLTSNPSSGASTPAVALRFPPPSTGEVARLLTAPPSPNETNPQVSILQVMEVKSHLVQTYVALQPHGWEPMFGNGEFAQVVMEAFNLRVGQGGEEAQKAADRYKKFFQARLAILKPVSS